MDLLDVLRAFVFGAVLLWLPGHLWGRILVPSARGVAGVVLAVGLSVSLIILFSYVGNAVAGIPLTGENAVLEALALSVAAFGVHMARRLRARFHIMIT